MLPVGIPVAKVKNIVIKSASTPPISKAYLAIFHFLLSFSSGITADAFCSLL